MDTMRFQGPGFALDVPTNWVVAASPQAQAVFFGPQVSGIQSNLIITIRRVATGVTLQEIARVSDENQRVVSANYTVLGEQDYTEEGGSAFVRRFTRTTGEGSVVEQIQALILVDTLLYTLTGTSAAEGDNPELTEVKALLDLMIRSFVVTS